MTSMMEAKAKAELINVVVKIEIAIVEFYNLIVNPFEQFLLIMKL